MEKLLKNKKVLVIGLGISGRSAVKFLLKRKAIVFAVDKNHELLKCHGEVKELIDLGLVALHESTDIPLDDFVFIVVSPGVPPKSCYYAKAIEAKKEIIGEVELACRYVNQPFIAVTGTNGKTTTTLLVTHILKESGLTATALGNVGIPITTEIDEQIYEEDNIFVVELSSFQLETLQSKVVDIGVILNITPDHLDRYDSMDSYAKSKIHLKNCMKDDKKIYIFENTLKDFNHLISDDDCFSYGYGQQCTVYTDKEKIYFNKNIELFLPDHYRGQVSHEVENIMAAFVICKEMHITSEQFLDGLKTFKKPSHRLEFVRSFKEISFYDDSKGTNIDAVIRAVNSFSGEILLIAGGVDKGSAYTPWIEAFAGKVKSVFAIGQAADKIENDLKDNLPVSKCLTLEDAVIDATKLAKPGQVVLLSPGCSSFDMFKDYTHRGDEFKRIVNELMIGNKNES